MSRRLVLQRAIMVAPAVVAAMTIAKPQSASAASRQAASGGVAPAIVPRSEWGGDLPVMGPMEAEAPGDVRFLLVHHTATSNDYSRSGSVQQLRSFYSLHTGPDKGWPDIAYNFLIDRFGVIHEGRTGSLEQPIKGSATGGSQGFAQLCCFVGDHSSQPPTEEAQASMVVLLAWLASRYGVPMSPGSIATFVSRGSNRWPAGQTVTTPTIAGHRDMSSTACPGDAAYVLLDARFRPEAAALVGDAPAAEPPTTVPPTAVPPTTTAIAPVPTSTETTTSVPPSTAAPRVTDPPRSTQPTISVAGRSEIAAGATDGGQSITPYLVGGALAVGTAAAATASVARHRRAAGDDEADAVEP